MRIRLNIVGRNKKMKRYIQPLVVVALFAGVASTDAAETMFPVPKAAYDVKHVVLKDVGTKQDYYKVRLAYPSMEVVEHYRALFHGWWECSNKRGWESFGDLANGKNEYVHQLIYAWVAPSNDKIVTLGLRYVSPGLESRPKSITNEQLVFVLLNEPVENAKAETEQTGLVCAPNKALKPTP
jgi:hypothetical protein